MQRGAIEWAAGVKDRDAGRVQQDIAASGAEGGGGYLAALSGEGGGGGGGGIGGIYMVGVVVVGWLRPGKVPRPNPPIQHQRTHRELRQHHRERLRHHQRATWRCGRLELGAVCSAARAEWESRRTC